MIKNKIELKWLITDEGKEYLKKEENLPVKIYDGNIGHVLCEDEVFTLMDAFNKFKECIAFNIYFTPNKIDFPIMNHFELKEDLINAGWITHELKPCPFCGETKIITGGEKNKNSGYIVYSASCGNWNCLASISCTLGGESKSKESREEVVKRWNNRN